MTELLERIQTIISSETRDLDQIERTLTDGYAVALSLEAEKRRLERRMAELTQGIQRGDTVKKARELATLSRRLDGNTGTLARLRALLLDLRTHANGVRIGSPKR
jgi:hypothetical protein